MSRPCVPFARRLGPVAGTVLLLSMASLPVHAEPLPREEVARIGKAATAVVQVRPHVLPQVAFCVHPAGYFVTPSYQIGLHARTGDVTLILDPGLPTQRSVKAQVVRTDQQLALLRAEVDKELPALSLGSPEDIKELAETAIVSIPTARPDDLRIRNGRYFPANITLQHVSALQRDDKGVLQSFRLDGGGGGPVLGRDGKVLGMVLSVPGVEPHTVFPVNRLAGLLERPHVQLIPPPLTRDNLTSPAPFRARVIQLTPASKPPKLDAELLVRAGDGRDHRHPMKLADGVYVAQAAVVPPDVPPLSVAVNYATGAVSGRAEDRAFKVGGREIRFSDVQRLRPGPRGEAVLIDGRTLAGVVEGLDGLTLTVGGQKVPLDLASAQDVRVDSPRRSDSVVATVVLQADGKPVESVSEVIRVSGRPQREPVVPRIKPPPLAESRVAYKLAAPTTDVQVGGGGRYLILFLPGPRRLEVFDVSEARVVHSVALPEEDVRFAAGLNDLYLLLPGGRVLQRGSLTRLEPPMSVPLPDKEGFDQLTVGAASTGPLLLTRPTHTGNLASQFLWLDGRTLKPLPMHLQQEGPAFPGIGTRKGLLRASADGTLFVMPASNSAPEGMLALVVQGERVRSFRERGLHGPTLWGPFLPSADGRVIGTRKGLVTPEGKPLDPKDTELHLCVPANRGPYYLRVTPGEMRYGLIKNRQIQLGVQGEIHPIASLPTIEFPVSTQPAGADPRKPNALSDDRRLYFIPEARLIVTIPYSNDQLILHRFDLDEALAGSTVEYLFVTSQPPRAAKRGETYRYPVEVKSKKGGVRFQLESGPKGMELAEDGTLTWKVPAGYGEEAADVVLLVHDAGKQERRHRFTIRVEN